MELTAAEKEEARLEKTLSRVRAGSISRSHSASSVLASRTSRSSSNPPLPQQVVQATVVKEQSFSKTTTPALLSRESSGSTVSSTRPPPVATYVAPISKSTAVGGEASKNLSDAELEAKCWKWLAAHDESMVENVGHELGEDHK